MTIQRLLSLKIERTSIRKAYRIYRLTYSIYKEWHF